MQSTRDIRRKIRSVANIQQITRAMKTVSSVKLRRAEGRIRAARPYAHQLAELVARMAGGEVEHPYLVSRPHQRSGVVVISADKGLAGSFNVSVVREAVARLRALPQASAITIGRRGTDSLRRLGLPTEAALSPLGAEPASAQVAPIADLVGQLYREGRWDYVELVYTRFRGGTRVEVIRQQLLPVSRPEASGAVGDYLYEPAPQELLGLLMPRYLRTLVYTAVLDSAASEHAARVVAMSLATDNAEKLIDSLTLQYNKSRQSTITRELIDIVGTAEAVS